MLKYYNKDILFTEIPNEISLTYSIIGCPLHCKECHSQFLWDNQTIGTILTGKEILKDISINLNFPTCVLFMGGDWDKEYLFYLISHIKKSIDVKTALYTGRPIEYFNNEELKLLDYIKVNPYIKELGDLKNPNTNQRLYTLSSGKIDKDITSLFWK